MRLSQEIRALVRQPMSTIQFDTNRGLELLRMMERIRAFEEQACLAAERDKLVLGAIHPSIGQEAVAAGIGWHLQTTDVLLATHRGHGHTLAKGTHSLAMMRELLGREGGSCGGKGGSMHIADFGVSMLGANGVVGANITIGAGAAHGIKLLGDSRIVVNVFGDGAINRGPFLEGINWAGVFDLPILFVCEDNQYSATTRTRDTTAGDGPIARAKALGLTATTVDGNDVEAVVNTCSTIFSRLRSGGGPEFLHAVTYRQTGHTASDAALYRPDGEAAEQIENNDPLMQQRQRLAGAGVTTQVLDDLRDQAQAEMIDALKQATDTPFPPISTAFTDVQDLGSPVTEPY